MIVKVKLRNGIYKITNGKDCDGMLYEAILVILDDNIFASEYTTWLENYELQRVELKEGEDLFEKLSVYNYEKLN